MDWYTKIKNLYNNGYWTKEQVQDALNFNKITQEEYNYIVNN